MLQMINTNGQAGLTAPTSDALPAGFAQAQAADAEAPAFDLQLALRGQSVDAEAAAVQAFAASQGDEPEPSSATEVDVEQWLLGMLDQQAVRVEARESVPGEELEAVAQQREQEAQTLADDVVVDEVVALPPLPNVEEPVMPTRQAEKPVVARQALPAAASGAQVLPVPTTDTTLQSSILATAGLDSGDGTPGADVPQWTLSETQSVSTSTASSQQASTQVQGAERTLKLHAPQAQWGEQMLQSLREHVDVQISQRIQNATIRLDPPELGSLEIFLSHESGRLNVQLSAANADVARLMQQTSDRLRQELVGQNFVQVNVQVSTDAQGGRQHEQAPRQAWFAEEAVKAASETLSEQESSTPDSTSDVLVTV